LTASVPRRRIAFDSAGTKLDAQFRMAGPRPRCRRMREYCR
jgi:hypothetical protein